ncbi:hypothetical protein K443DRAFT_100525, partial [Laccaria amethystina LaAM-08-1]
SPLLKTFSRCGCNKSFDAIRSWFSLWSNRSVCVNGLLMTLIIFYYREEHQTIRTVQPAEYSLHVAASSSSSVHASTVLGTLNQDLLLTPPFPVSVKVGVALLPDNPSLTFIPTVKSLSLTSTTLHYRYLPAIAELNPTDYNTVQYVRYTSSSSMVNEGVREDFIETSTINVLESWALAALPLR